MHFKSILSVAALATLLASGGAQAASIISPTSTISGNVITFNEYDEVLTSAQDLGNGVFFTSSPYARVGAVQQDLEDNGLWGFGGDPVNGLVSTPRGDGNFLASAFITNRGEFGFTFDAPVQSVGAFVNQFQAWGATNNSMLVVAYDADGNDLESFRVSVNTPFDSYNEGLFVGFQRASADIYGFGLVDGTFVLDNLTYAVPEPGSLALTLAGLGVIVSVFRRRQTRD